MISTPKIIAAAVLIIFFTYASEYKAPGTTRHPLGDENLNNNVLDGSAPKECVSSCDDDNAEGKCHQPMQTCGSDDNAKGNNVPCKRGSTLNDDVLYSADSVTKPEVQCKKCNLNITPDNVAVIVKCYECFELPPPSKSRRNSKSSTASSYDIAYLVYFVQISNYTAVDGNYLNLNLIQNESEIEL